MVTTSPDASIRANHRFYESLWAATKLYPPARFNTWPLLSRLAAAAPARLEVGAGGRPRLPLPGTHFVDLSAAAVRKIGARGGLACTAEIDALPYRDGAFDLLCAFDIVEHVADDCGAFAEFARVVRPGGTVVLSVPLYMRAWTFFDELVGHCRRYEPADLLALLERSGLVLDESAAYGMQPRSQRLLRIGVWWLQNHPVHAMRWYNRFIFPIALRLGKRLRFVPGLVDDPGVDEVVLVCRRR